MFDEGTVLKYSAYSRHESAAFRQQDANICRN